MTDNPEEEHLSTPINTESENTSDDTTPITEIENIPQTQETENMEVHHHAQHGHGKKTWKSYFWEFFMLFMAVFCGSLAELQLEHYIEHQREKKFAILLYNDLKSDTVYYNRLDKNMLTGIRKFKNKKTLLLNSKMLADSSFANIATDLWIAFGFNSTTTTFNQMKTSGSLRYMRNDSLIAKLSNYYDKIIPAISTYFDHINQKLHDQIEPIYAEYFNIFETSTSDITSEPANVYLNRSESSDMIIKNKLFQYYLGINFVYKFPLQNTKERAVQLLSMLKEEYSLE
jgi:hypothetical protein